MIRHLAAAIILIAFTLTGTACREIPSDRLFALKLTHAPAAGDWERALPRMVTVKGGVQHKEKALPDVDEDTVHTSTPSCHHGGELPDPLTVDMRAFYTDSHLFLRLSWPDATRDDALQRWRFDGEIWHNEGGLEDGFGILWAPPEKFDRFTCSYACHIADFGVSGNTFHASNSMRTADPDLQFDLWNWKADRTGRHGFADDRWIDSEGMHGDIPGELFQENSLAALSEPSSVVPFSETDRPLTDADGHKAADGYHPPGTTAPGYRVERPRAGRADVSAFGRHENGRWTVILKRKLDTGDARDLSFHPGDPQGTAFGLAIMDNTLAEHYASVLNEKLVLLAEGATVQSRGSE